MSTVGATYEQQYIKTGNSTANSEEVGAKAGVRNNSSML